MSSPYQPNDDPTYLSPSDWSAEPPSPPTPYQPSDDPTIYSQIEPTAAYPPSSNWSQPANAPQPGYPPVEYPAPAPNTPAPVAPATIRARRPHRLRWVACGIVIGVLLLPCLCVGAIAGYFVVQYSGSTSALNTFCADLKARNYSAAYDLFAPIYQVHVTRDQFVKSSQILDQREGTVTSCSLPHSNFKLANNSVSLLVAITRSRAARVTGNVGLVKVGGKWRVAVLDPQLGYPA